MATKRTRATRNVRSRVTPEALAAFRAGDESALNRALRLKPWESTPLDVQRNGAEDLGYPAHWNWTQAVELLAELTEADNAE